MMRCRATGLGRADEDPVFRDKGVWRKTPLFDRFLTFDTKLPPDGPRRVTRQASMSMRLLQGARCHSPGRSAQHVIADTATDAHAGRERHLMLPCGDAVATLARVGTPVTRPSRRSLTRMHGSEIFGN